MVPAAWTSRFRWQSFPGVWKACIAGADHDLMNTSGGHASRVRDRHRLRGPIHIPFRQTAPCPSSEAMHPISTMLTAERLLWAGIETMDGVEG
jgi:hypothetical protein